MCQTNISKLKSEVDIKAFTHWTVYAAFIAENHCS
jgi:hypothetical protein